MVSSFVAEMFEMITVTLTHELTNRFQCTSQTLADVCMKKSARTTFPRMRSLYCQCKWDVSGNSNNAVITINHHK